jgi:rRNA-processing protein FCF1
VKVILDSNTIIMMGKGIITCSMLERLIERRFDLVTTSTVINELNNLSENNSKAISKAIKFALSLVKDKLTIINTDNIADADDSIFYVAYSLRNNENDVYVVTSDKELRGRLRLIGVPTIYFRNSRSGLELEWDNVS